MEGHTKRLIDETLYAHIHFEGVPVLEGKEQSPEIIAIDAISDQTPLMKLRGITDFTPTFSGITWTTTPEIKADLGLVVKKIYGWADNSLSLSGTYPGVKQISLVCRKETLDRDSFYNSYKAHTKIARKHHGMQNYAQNIELKHLYGSHPDNLEIDGISELWFSSRKDLEKQFYLHSNSAEIVRKDTETFIDFRKTKSIMVSETRFRSNTNG